MRIIILLAKFPQKGPKPPISFHLELILDWKILKKR